MAILPIDTLQANLIRFGILVFCFWLSGCAGLSMRPSIETSAKSRDLLFADQQWQTIHFPGKRATQFDVSEKLGRVSIRAVSERSASLLFFRPLADQDSPSYIGFSWNVFDAISGADVSDRDREDAVARVILRFEGDRTRFSAKNRALSELSLVLTGEELPYATLMYVWCNKRQVGEVITNPRTDRIRKIVVESGPKNLGQWLDYKRDIRADFIAAFGEEPGRLTGIALMTDTDNTQSRATTWYGPVRLTATTDQPRAR